MTTRLASGACWLAAMVFCGLCLGCAGWQDSAYLQGLGRLVPRNAIAMHVGHSPTQAPAWQPRVRRLRSCVLTMTSEPGSSERSGRGGRQRPENVGKQIQNQPDGGEASMGRGSVLRGGYRTGGRGRERGRGRGGGRASGAARRPGCLCWPAADCRTDCAESGACVLHGAGERAGHVRGRRAPWRRTKHGEPRHGAAPRRQDAHTRQGHGRAACEPRCTCQVNRPHRLPQFPRSSSAPRR